MSAILDYVIGLKGSARILISLLNGPKHRGQIEKKAENDMGIVWRDEYMNARNALLKVNLIKSYEVHVKGLPLPRAYLELTEKGKEVANHLKSIEEILRKQTA